MGRPLRTGAALDNDDRLVLAQITITKYLDETIDGGVGIETDYSDDLPMIEAMGLIAFVAQNVQGDYQEMFDEDE